MTTSTSTVLSQDLVMTDTIPVDSTSPAPTAPFPNPFSGFTEALVITSGRLGHVSRDTTGEAGWRLDPLSVSGGVARSPNEATAATEVAGGTSYASSGQPLAVGVYTDSTALHVITLAGGGWSAPTALTQQPHSHLRAAYSPLGKLAVYSITLDGNLAVTHQPSVGGSFAVQIYTMPAPLSDGNYALSLTSDDTWMVASGSGGQLSIYTGTLDGTSTTPTGGAATNYTGTVQQVVFGYWSGAQSAQMFVFVDSTGTLQTWSSAGVAPVPSAVTTGTICTAGGHVYVDPTTYLDTVHLYTVDANQQLAVLHQDLDQPWNDDNSPNWAAAVPLDTQVAGVAVDSCPTQVPTLFGMSAGDFSLRLHTQDAATSMWQAGAVLQSGAQAFEVTRYRAEITFYDDQGHPMPAAKVAVSLAAGSSGTDIAAGGSIYPITAAGGTTLTTDTFGKLTLAVLTNAGLAAPTLVLDAGDGATTTICPAQGIHDYLAGAGPLNPTNPTNPANGSGALPTFDAKGATLTAAVVSGQPLAPGATSGLAGVAAQALQQSAAIGSGTTPAIVGFYGDLSRERPRYLEFSTRAEFDAHLATLPDAEPGSVWSDIGHFFSDVWEGIKNGVIVLKDFVVDAVNKIAQLTLQIANEIQHGIKLALTGLEQAAQFMAGVFQAVEADIDKVIDWLKALFDFGAIWRTKMIMQTAIAAVPGYMKYLVGLATTDVDGWFGRKEAELRGYFDSAKAHYSGQTFGAQSNYQGPGQSSSSTKVAGGASPADFRDNVHHNWLQDKVNSAAGDNDLGLGPNEGLLDPATQFATNVNAAGSNLVDGLKSFADAVETVIKNPETFATTGVADLITAFEDILTGLLQACDALVDGVLALADLVMDALSAILTTVIDIPVLQTLWTWIATAAGYPADDEFTIGALIALIGAFPTTVIYKLIVGVDSEPYPQQSGLLAAAGDHNVGPVPFYTPPDGLVLASAILQTLYVVPAIAGDLMTQNTPTWLTVGSVVLSAAIWAFANGFPDLTGLEWYMLSIVGGILGLLLLEFRGLVVALGKKIAALPNDFFNWLLTIYGGVMFCYRAISDMVQIAKKDPTDDAEHMIAGILLPLPSFFSFCNLSTFQDDPEVQPFATTVKIAFDVIGYVGGGVILVVDAALKLAKAPAAIEA